MSLLSQAELHSFCRVFSAGCEFVHKANLHWWQDPATGKPIERNVGELLMLCVSELSEAMEGHRKAAMDDHLPDRLSIEVEIADCIIRLMDLSAGLGLDVAGAWVDKMIYNSKRYDHTNEARMLPGGKKY